MEHFIRIAFWIATLFGCLLAVPLLDSSEDLPQLPDSKIDNIRKSVICEPNSQFYTPENVEEQCIAAALDCIVKELNQTAKWECKDEEEYLEQEVGFLESIIQSISKLQTQGLVLQTSTECACEKWPEKPFSEFLTKTTTLQEQSITILLTKRD